ncbi:MAG TPA: hypothetical protein VG479_03260 [Gaiellaceae bacterium]|nr:hypothetical protein [Gaiellaceae bacterium]
MVRLYWAKNDGMGGHVFLALRDLDLLSAEMDAQGMTGWLALERLEPGTHVPPGAVDFALSQASSEPQVLEVPVPRCRERGCGVVPARRDELVGELMRKDPARREERQACEPGRARAPRLDHGR